jgi:hypothetical protein
MASRTSSPRNGSTGTSRYRLSGRASTTTSIRSQPAQPERLPPRDEDVDDELEPRRVTGPGEANVVTRRGRQSGQHGAELAGAQDTHGGPAGGVLSVIWH